MKTNGLNIREIIRKIGALRFINTDLIEFELGTPKQISQHANNRAQAHLNQTDNNSSVFLFFPPFSETFFL